MLLLVLKRLLRVKRFVLSQELCTQMGQHLQYKKLEEVHLKGLSQLLLKEGWQLYPEEVHLSI